MVRRLMEAGVLLCVLAAAALLPGRMSERATQEGDARPAEEFRIVPVRVHLMRAPKSAAMGTKLTAEDIARILRKANGIWHAAGIHLWVESVVEEAPAHPDRHEDDSTVPLDALLALRPAATRAEGMFHVYYVGAMAVNGIYIDWDATFVQEAARLVPVPGGIDEPLPRVTAHELGHAMGLSHRQARTNLMASGTTGTSLNDAEIETVRRTVDGVKWVLPAEEFLKKADDLAAAGKKEAAAARYRTLLDLPGKSAFKEHARQRLER